MISHPSTCTIIHKNKHTPTHTHVQCVHPQHNFIHVHTHTYMYTHTHAPHTCTDPDFELLITHLIVSTIHTMSVALLNPQTTYTVNNIGHYIRPDDDLVPPVS